MLFRSSSLTGTKKLSRTDAAYTEWLNTNMPKVGYIGGREVKMEQDGKLRMVVVKDIYSTLPAEIRKNFEDGLKANGMPKAQRDAVLAKYDEINEADAQSWMTLPSYREFLLRSGDWTNKHEKAYHKAIHGTALSANEIFLFPPLKPQYYGPQQAQGIFIPTFVKTSISPLIPSVVKGTDLEALMNKMYEGSIDLTSTESAVKVGGKVGEDGQFVDLFKNVNGIAQINTDDFSPVVSELFYDYMGIQLDVAPIRKTSTTRGTQEEKISVVNIDNIEGGREMLAEYKDTITKLIANAKADMFTETGIVVKNGNYLIPDRTKLFSFLEAQAISRGVPKNTLVGLNEALKNGSSLDAVVNKDRIDNILASIINNNTIRSKRKGEQKVQVAITGTSARTFEGNNLLTDSSLLPYIYDPTGTKPMEIKVALPKNLVNYVESIGEIGRAHV